MKGFMTRATGDSNLTTNQDTIEMATSAQLMSQTPALELFSLRGKNALVTGGSRDIGAAISIASADAGASVCIAQRDTSNTATADAIHSRGGRAKTIACDLTDVHTTKNVFQEALNIMDGEIDILVNCAGILKRKECLEVTESDWDGVREEKKFYFLTSS